MTARTRTRRFRAGCLILLVGLLIRETQAQLPEPSVARVPAWANDDPEESVQSGDDSNPFAESLGGNARERRTAELNPIAPTNFESLAQVDSSPAPAAAAPPASNQVPFSGPTPFQIGPETPAAGNSQNFYPGNPPVQDLSGLLPGRFANTKYKWYGFVRLDGIFDFDPIGSTDDFVTSTAKPTAT